MERVIFTVLNCVGPYCFVLLFLWAAFKNRRQLDWRKTLVVAIVSLAAMSVLFYMVFIVFAEYLNPFIKVALLAGLTIAVCFMIFRCTLLEALFVYFVIKNFMDDLFMVAKIIQVYMIMKISGMDEAGGFILSYMISAVIVLPLIYLFLKKLIRPCIDITEGMPFWKFLWMLPVFYYIVYKLGISPDYPSPEVIWSKTVIMLPIIWGIGTTLSYAIMVRALTDITRLTEDKERLRASRQQVKLQQEQYLRLQNNIEETARMRHDWRQQVVMLQSYAQKDDCGSIRIYLDKYIRESQALDQASVCENYAVDAIAQHYISMAREKGISVKSNFQVPDNFSMCIEDMYVVLGNLLENALEACARQKEEKRFIHIDVNVLGKSNMAVMIENSYGTEVVENNGRFLSAKREGEGIGLSSVRNIIEKNNGVLNIEYGQGVFKVSVLTKFA